MQFVKQGWLVVFSCISLVEVSHAKQYRTDDMPMMQNLSELQINTLQQRYCLYAGKTYSLGALITADNFVLECRPEQNVELNGALKWVLRQPVSVDITP